LLGYWVCSLTELLVARLTILSLCESFFATLKSELTDRYRFRVLAEAKAALFSFIESWDNQHRRHSSSGYLSPNNYELQHRKLSRNSQTVH
jgi:transposase InsO family protein